MKRKGSWFFEGYQRENYEKEDGSVGSKLVYTGEWYGLQGGKAELTTMKKRCVLLFLLCYVPAFIDEFFPSEGGMVRWMAIPSLLILIPMIWQVMGLINFLVAKEKWEARVFYAGYRRLYRSSVVAMVLLVCWDVMEIVYICMNLTSLSGELVYLLLLLLSTAGLGLLLWQIRVHPPVVVEGPLIR